MFTINSKIKKLIQSGDVCGYIYKDGIELLETRRVTSGKFTTNIDVYHYFPCEIGFRSHNYDRTGSEIVCNRIVVHSPSMLLSGLESVEIHYNNTCERDKTNGTSNTTAEFRAPNGMIWRYHNHTNHQNTDISIQPDPVGITYHSGSPSSIYDCIQYSKDHYQNYEIHE